MLVICKVSFSDGYYQIKLLTEVDATEHIVPLRAICVRQTILALEVSATGGLCFFSRKYVSGIARSLQKLFKSVTCSYLR